MKLSKEDEWRISGMQYALKIAKKDGIEALEKEINFRCRYEIPLDVSQKTINKFTDNVKANMFDTMKIMVSSTLRDEFDFGAKRLQRFIQRFEQKCECMIKDYCSWQDQIDSLKEETGLEMSIRENNKNVKCD